MKETSETTRFLYHMTGEPLVIVLSGSSGVGKDAVLTKLKESGYPLTYIVTITTRPQRVNEQDYVNYHFISEEKFREMMDNKDLLEWANVYGNWYGVPKEPVNQALAEGRDIIVKVDVQGAATIKKIMPRAILIFLMSSSKDELANRLKQRHTEKSLDLALRTEIARDELKQLPLFNYVVVNRQGKLNQAVADIKAIIRAEKLRVRPL